MRVIELPELPMQRQLHMVFPQGEPSGLAETFMRFADQLHNQWL
jgi:hypothetical protein